jgi:CBS domain-containing protein
MSGQADKEVEPPMKTSGTVGALLHHKGNRIWSIHPDATVFEAIQFLAHKNIGAILVMDGEQLVGVMSERDYTRKVALKGRSSKETKVREIVSAKVISVTSDHSVEDCMRLMTDNRIRHLPVLDAGKVLGVISIGDLVNWTISQQNSTLEQMEQYISGGFHA